MGVQDYGRWMDIGLGCPPWQPLRLLRPTLLALLASRHPPLSAPRPPAARLQVPPRHVRLLHDVQQLLQQACIQGPVLQRVV